jgi:hypothetical protein
LLPPGFLLQGQKPGHRRHAFAQILRNSHLGNYKPGAGYFLQADFLRVKGFYSNIWGTANLFPMQDPIESGSHEIVAYGYAYRSAKHLEYLRFPESMMQMPCGVLYPDKNL